MKSAVAMSSPDMLPERPPIVDISDYEANRDQICEKLMDAATRTGTDTTAFLFVQGDLEAPTYFALGPQGFSIYRTTGLIQ